MELTRVLRRPALAGSRAPQPISTSARLTVAFTKQASPSRSLAATGACYARLRRLARRDSCPQAQHSIAIPRRIGVRTHPGARCRARPSMAQSAGPEAASRAVHAVHSRVVAAASPGDCAMLLTSIDASGRPDCPHHQRRAEATDPLATQATIRRSPEVLRTPGHQRRGPSPNAPGSRFDRRACSFRA